MTIPSDDIAFREHVRRTVARHAPAVPDDLERRLRRLFPRVAVHARELSGEAAQWYVYRDGAWRAPGAPWWRNPRVPHLVFAPDGWLGEANPAASSLLGIDGDTAHHVTDFAAPGTTDDAVQLFAIVADGHHLSGTLVVRPMGGDVIACEIRAERLGDALHAWLRLADDIAPDAPHEPGTVPDLSTEPADDTVFAAFAARSLASLADPSPDGLALRLRRLYPHARVAVGDASRWTVLREPPGRADGPAVWWHDPSLPLVRYDDRGLIVEANRAARDLLGEWLVGHHWQELVTPGSHDQVQPVLDMIRAAGEVVSRFRMPRYDGRLVEFDSHTRVDGEEFETTMRPVEAGPDARTPAEDEASDGG